MNKATKVLMSVFVMTIMVASTALAQNTPFFSQYMEGSSNNKALEIYNPTADTVWLSGYAFPNVGNAPTVVGEYEFWNNFPDTHYIAPGEVYVITHPDADSVIKAEADYTFTFLSNGDDGFALVEGDSAAGSSFAVIDWLGNWDGDPGSGWDVAGVPNGTQNKTLVRKPTIMTGSTDWAVSAGTNAVDSEWFILDQDVYLGLGEHSVDMTVSLGDDPIDVINAWTFEDTTAGIWVVDTNPDFGVGGSLTVAADIAASGDFAGKLTADSLEKTGITTYDIAGLGIQEGDTLYFRIWVSSANLAKFDGLQPYTQSGNSWQQWSDAYYSTSEFTADTWTWVKVGVPAPADGIFKKAGLQVTGSAANASEMPVVYVDDILVVRPGGLAPEPVAVTFNVNTATMPDTLQENHTIQIRGGLVGNDVAGTGLGSMVTWDAASMVTTNVGGDYWTITFDMSPGDTLNYKFWAGVDVNTPLINGGEQGWESGGNNQFILPADAVGDTTAPMQWFETREAPFTSVEDSVTVYFKVNVGAQVQTQVFNPETESIGVLGNGAFFPADWGSAGVPFKLTQLPNPTGDNLFYGGYHRIHKDSVATLGGAMGYKFVIENDDASIGWEEGDNSFVTVPAADTTLQWKFFSNTPPSNAKIITTGLNFEVNVGILEGLGYFNSSLDSVYTTGTFNSWNNTANQMVFNDISGNYEALNLPLTTTVGSNVSYKYYIRWDASRDDAESENYFEFISANDDGWEEPGITGGGNRVFDIEDADQQPTRTEFFNGVEPQALLTANNVDGGAIDVVFSIDMSAATEASTPFRPGTDSVFLSVETPFFALTQNLPTYSDDIATRSLELRDRMMFTDPDQDMIYELTLPLQLPTLNNIGFNVAYGEPTSATGTIITAGPGGTDAGRRFYQYVQPMVNEALAVSWPTTFRFPTLTWSADPLPYELPPSYNAVDNEVETEVAREFVLDQNYPNPFNPTTNITFKLANAANVKLTVFNVLGQEVASLINGVTMTSGSHTVAFDASSLSSGMYIYRLEAGSFVSTKRMMLIK